jgi:hypothetical protein
LGNKPCFDHVCRYSKNPDVVNTIIYAPEVSDSFREKFNSQLEIYNSSYESKKNEVKLIKGESPAKPF